MGVEALVDEELAPGRRAIGVQPRVAGHLQLGAEEERGVRVDQQQGVAVLGVGRGDGEAVRAGRFAEFHGLRELAGLDLGRGLQLGLAVEGLQLAQRDPLDVAADAALGEAQRHPRLEPGDDLRLHGGMGGQVEVQPVGPGVHQAFSQAGLLA
jgi:hypothetical protein